MEDTAKFSPIEMVEVSKNISEMIGNIDIESFAKHMQILVNMLKLMGRLVEIGFSDIISKVDILFRNQKLLAEKGVVLNTLEECVKTEIELGIEQLNGSNNKKLGFKKGSEYEKYIGCSRTILRLYRFLLFVQRICEYLAKDRSDKFSSVISKAYSEVLAKHHSFLIRNASKGIMYLVPSRESFFKSIIGDEEIDEEQLYEIIDQWILYSKIITDYLWEFYNERGLLELP